MGQIITIVVTLAIGLAFSQALSLQVIFAAFQPMTVVLSIMVAAILVRLNRGMPNLDWTAIDPPDRMRLTSGILELTREYVGIIVTNMILLVVLISLTTFGKEAFPAWPIWLSRTASGVVGGLAVLSLVRMTYVVWRDFDIVKLQKELIDKAAQREQQTRDNVLANETIAVMRAAGVRKIEPEH